MGKKIRVLVAKPSGLHQTVEMIVEAAVQEDVDVVGLSILSGAHMTFFPDVMKALQDAGAGHIIVTGGGIIPEEDVAALKEKGVAALYTPGTPLPELVEGIRKAVEERSR